MLQKEIVNFGYVTQIFNICRCKDVKQLEADNRLFNTLYRLLKS